MSGSKISIVLGATALLVSVLFATPLGQAAGRLVLAKNSVGAAQIKKNAVNSRKVKNGTLLAADFKAGQLRTGAQGAKGDKGDPGAQGIQGAKGAQGVPGLAGLEFVDLDSASDSTTPKNLFPTCPAGKRAISVSPYIGTSVGAVGFVTLTEAYVIGSNAGAVQADEVGGGTASVWSLHARLICANVQ